MHFNKEVVTKGEPMKPFLFIFVFILTFNSAISGDRLKEELNLTEEQAKKVLELRQSNGQEKRKLKEQVRQLGKAFKDSQDNENTSNDELINRFQAFQKARADLQQERFNSMLEMRSILTPNQRKQFNELKKNKRHKGRKDF
jgi:Spy/CpxP family protein refolding chaperone